MTITITKATVGGSEDQWGTITNTALDDLVNVLNGVTASTPDLTAGSWKVGGVAVTSTAAELNILDGVTATAAELNYVDGVTSNIQTQFGALSSVYAPLASPTFTGTVTTPSLTVSGGTQNWTATASGTNLTFAYNGVDKMRIDSNGNLTVTGDVTAFGSL